MYARYQEAGETFADDYLGLLHAGGSDWPHELVGQVGVDLEDEGFWERGLSQIEDLIEEAESLAETSDTPSESAVPEA